MDATTTPLTPSLIQTLKSAHPSLTFTTGDGFLWSPSKQTVFYNPSDPHAAALLLHELAHALLDHRSYQRDVELLAMETAAWETAQAYTAEHPELHIAINETVVQDHLDTYRDWLHARSTCPQCTATGYQTAQKNYACPACTHTWRVNEARVCSLRRYATPLA